MSLEKRPFRKGDKVIVSYNGGTKRQGFILWDKYRNTFGNKLIILVDDGGRDTIEILQEDGRRYATNRVVIELGVLKKC